MVSTTFILRGFQVVVLLFLLLITWWRVDSVGYKQPPSTHARYSEELKLGSRTIPVITSSGLGWMVNTELKAPLGSIISISNIQYKFLTSEEPLYNYYQGKNIVGTITGWKVTSYECDLFCHNTQLVSKARRAIQRQWGENLCQLESPCQKEVTLAESLTIGKYSQIDAETKQLWIDINLYHIVVVSGYQLAMIALLLEWIGRQSRLSVIPRWLVTITLLVLYAWFTGGEAPVVRSLMGILVAGGVHVWLGRELSPWRTIVYSALLSLWIFPYWIHSLSFWLSITATIGVLIGSILLSTYPKSVPWYLQVAVITISTYLTTLPITSIFYNTTSLGGLVANLIILPILPLLSLLAVGSIIPIIGYGFGLLFIQSVQIILWLLNYIRTVFAWSSWKIEPFETIEMIGWYSMVIVLFLISYRYSRAGVLTKWGY